MGELSLAAGIDGARFREVIGHFTTGVAVITTSHAGQDYGMSASSVTSVSADPPMLLVCLNALTATQDAVSASGTFCVNVLAEGQDGIALRFARPRTEEKFRSLSIERGVGGAAVLADALAALQCVVTDTVEAGTHRIFIARVEHAWARDGAPLAYFRGAFGRAELRRDVRAIAELRSLIHTLAPAHDEPLHPDDLGHRLDLPAHEIRHALRELESDGMLVRRDSDQLFLAPIDQQAYDEAFDARGVIELGVAEQTVGNATAEQLQRLRALMEATTGLIARGRFTDAGAYVDANAALHEFMISLPGSDMLRDTYRRLDLPMLMQRLFSAYDQADDDLIDEHRVLVEAYEDGNLERARSAIRAHLDHAKATNHAAIAALSASR